MERLQENSLSRKICPQLETLRPNWTDFKYIDSKLNLSNNICYDSILLKDANNLISNGALDLRQYTDEASSYHDLSDHYNISPRTIVIGAGIGELITRILKLPIIKKLSIISPTWPMVEVYSEIFGLDFSTSIDENSNAIYLANPNGMTGELLDRQTIEGFLNRFDLVVLDEAYGDFVDSNYSFVQDASRYDNLIVLKTFSKSLSLAGLRFGYGFSNQDLISRLQLIRPSCVINSITNQITKNLLELIPSHVSRMLDTKKYIEEKYDCLTTYGNFVIFKNYPDNFKNVISAKNIQNIGTRMALLDIDSLKRLTENV